MGFFEKKTYMQREVTKTENNPKFNYGPQTFEDRPRSPERHVPPDNCNVFISIVCRMDTHFVQYKSSDFFRLNIGTYGTMPSVEMLEDMFGGDIAGCSQISSRQTCNGAGVGRDSQCDFLQNPSQRWRGHVFGCQCLEFPETLWRKTKLCTSYQGRLESCPLSANSSATTWTANPWFGEDCHAPC